MKKLFILIALIQILLPAPMSAGGSSSGFQPHPDSKAVVEFGKARFTVLTPRLIRMEWSENARFEDRATLGVINREFPLPDFKVKQSASKLIIETSQMTLSYVGQEKFSSENILITFNMADSQGGVRKVTWFMGLDDSANLLGTSRTLDGCAGEKDRSLYDKSVISRDGWAVLDESIRHVFVPVDGDWEYWVGARPRGERQDLYFFAYGHDYISAIRDFTKLSGNIPLPPKYTFGYWWSRWWQYSDYELLDLADRFDEFNIPIDVMIVDMDWHETWTEIADNTPPRKEGEPAGRDEFGQKIGWSGYTWKKDFFPNPENFIADLHKRNIKTSLNLHFNNGIQPYEEPYERFVADYLSRTSDYDGPKGYVYDAPYKFKGNDYLVGKTGEKAPVPFRISQREWSDAFFKTIIRPLEEQGIDFWWLDWQQWKRSKYQWRLSTTFWLNHAFFHDKVRQTASQGIHAPRPMIYHRWGGIGSHRYPVGFSGDTYASWDVLAFLPYFTATASNVGFGYWGHDIGGFKPLKGQTECDAELYTRWLQYGVFTPIFKTHSRKSMVLDKRFWMFPDHFAIMKEAVRLRYDLSPYIYNAARQAYDTGISITRPLYYYWPEEDKAYDCKEEYMFGDDILATVISKPADAVTCLAERPMWFPEGTDWYDMSTGTMYKGGSDHLLLYTIDENPYFVKAGSVIPMAGHDIMDLQTQDNQIRLLVVPGNGDFTTSIYEDDGQTQAYTQEYAITQVTKNTTDKAVVVNVAPRKGKFAGMLPTRKVSLVLDGFLAPAKVTVNGIEIPYSRFAKQDAKEGKQVWGYDGKTLQTTITLSESSCYEGLVIECSYEKTSTSPVLNGKKGLARRVMALAPEAKILFATFNRRDYQLPSELLDVVSCSSRITEEPYKAEEYLEKMDIKAMVDNMNSWEKLSGNFKRKVTEQMKFER